MEVWLKGEDDCEVLVEMWGPSFKKLLEDATVGVSVLQVDNARVVRNNNGSVSLSAEHFKDSERVFETQISR